MTTAWAVRIRLSTQIGSGLMGMLYVLNEPSISWSASVHRSGGPPLRYTNGTNPSPHGRTRRAGQ